MHEAHARGELPAVAVSSQPAGVKDFHQLAVILLEASARRRHPLGNIERLGDQRREAFHQHPRHEGDEHEFDVQVEDENARTKRFVVIPGRVFQIVEELAQGLRRVTESLLILLYPRLDEPVQVRRRQGGKLLHHRIEYRVAYGGMLDVIVGFYLIPKTGLLITFGIG